MVMGIEFIDHFSRSRSITHSAPWKWNNNPIGSMYFVYLPIYLPFKNQPFMYIGKFTSPMDPSWDWIKTLVFSLVLDRLLKV